MNRKPSKHVGKHELAKWTDNQKLEVATTYCLLGNLTETALVTGVSINTIKDWRYKDWWKELITQIRDEDVQQLSSNIQRVVNKALKATEDRIDKGDFQYDPKTGKIIRIPVKAHITLKATTDLLIRQEKLRAIPQRAEVEKTIDARLSKLADEFMRFATSKASRTEKTVEGQIVPNNISESIAAT